MSKIKHVVRTSVGVVACVVVVAGLLLWLAGTFNDRTEPGEPTDGRVRLSDASTVTCRAADVAMTRTAVGTIKALSDVTVSSQILARVKEIRATAGKPIRRDDVLVELEAADLKSRLEQAVAARTAAQAVLDQRQADFDRIKKLRASNAATEREYTTAENTLRGAAAALDGAEQAVSEARTQLGYATIRSPIDGIVIDKLAEAGDMASPGQPLVKLYSQLQLVATVPESMAARLSQGDALDVGIDALGKQCTGTVSEIVPQADPASRSFDVKVTGPCAPGVIPGMFGRLSIPMGTQRELRVPVSAVLRVGQLDMVLVVEDGFVRRRYVRIGQQIEDPAGGRLVEITSGLDLDTTWTLVADAAAFWAEVTR